MNNSPEKPKKTRRRVQYKFEVRAVPLDTYPDLMMNPMNSWTDATDEERLKGVSDGLAAIILDSRKAA